MNEEELTEKWKEIIATANNGDPQYSFELFKGIILSAIDEVGEIWTSGEPEEHVKDDEDFKKLRAKWD